MKRQSEVPGSNHPRRYASGSACVNPIQMNNLVQHMTVVQDRTSSIQLTGAASAHCECIEHPYRPQSHSVAPHRSEVTTGTQVEWMSRTASRQCDPGTSTMFSLSGTDFVTLCLRAIVTVQVVVRSMLRCQLAKGCTHLGAKHASFWSRLHATASSGGEPLEQLVRLRP